MLRLAVTAAAVALVGSAVGGVVWLRNNVVPPDCEDARTLALVRQSLMQQFKLPASLSLENIHMLAGGYLSFRFVCEARLEGIDKQALPDGPVPGSAHYVSRLSGDRRRHEVSVSIQPQLRLERVQ